MHRWLSGIAGLVGVVVFLLTIAYGPAGSPTPTALVGMSPAAAQTPTAAPGEPFYLKAIDHDKAKRGGTLRLAAHGPPSMFDIYASGTIANVGAQAPMYDLHGPGTRFEVGRAIILRDGDDAALIGTGETLVHCLLAAGHLKERHGLACPNCGTGIAASACWHCGAAIVEDTTSS